MKIDLSALLQQLETLILDQVGTTVSNTEKMDAVVAAAVEWCDERLVFHGPFGPVAEGITDLLIRALPLRQLAQEVYGQLRVNGKV